MKIRPRRWLFLRGLIRSQDHWLGFREQFADHLQVQTVAFDIAGVGKRFAETSATNIDAMIDDLRQQWLTVKSGDDAWGILAISLGGMLALQWLTRHPQDFEAAVIINSSLRGLSPAYRRLQPEVLRRGLPMLWRRQPVDREKIILRLTSNVDARRDWALPQWTDIAQRFPIGNINAVRQLLAASRCPTPPAPLPVPTLVLASTEDRIVHPSCSIAIARHYGTAYDERTCVGHDLPLDDPAWTCETIHRWLGKIFPG